MVESDPPFPEEASVGAGLGPEIKIWTCLEKSEVGKQMVSCLALVIHIVMSLRLFTERSHPFHLFIPSV